MTSPKFKRLFSFRERSIFSKCVPWTRLFGDYVSDTINGKKINLVKYALENKDRLILKPAVGTCGKNVFVGITYSDKEWSQIIRDVLTQRYIIQERVEILEEYFPAIRNGNLIFEKRRIDILPMMFQGKYFGSWSRCASGYILNGYQGGIIGINYTID